MPKPIGTLGTLNTLTVGGRVFTDIDNLIQLGCTIPSAPNVACALFLDALAPAAYQVTAGKVLTLGAFTCNMYANVASGATVGFADTAISVAGAASPGTNAETSSQSIYMATALGAYGERPIVYRIPATKYPYALAGGGNAVIITWGYEA